jgi:hypothetical protein
MFIPPHSTSPPNRRSSIEIETANCSRVPRAGASSPDISADGQTRIVRRPDGDSLRTRSHSLYRIGFRLSNRWCLNNGSRPLQRAEAVLLEHNLVGRRPTLRQQDRREPDYGRGCPRFLPAIACIDSGNPVSGGRNVEPVLPVRDHVGHDLHQLLVRRVADGRGTPVRHHQSRCHMPVQRPSCHRAHHVGPREVAVSLSYYVTVMGSRRAVVGRPFRLPANATRR